MTKLRQIVSLLALALLVGGVPAGVDAAQVQTKVKPMKELLAGKLPLSVSPAQRKAVIATKGGLSFNCNGTLCVCSGDVDCNDMFSHNVCGIHAICVDNFCYCSRD